MIFVTGGTGLIGAHLLFELVSSGKRVRALKREKSNLQQVLKIFSYYSDTPESLFTKIEWVNGDILDYFGLEQLLPDVEEVYHCAAVVSFNPRERRKVIRNNCEGTANMVNAAIDNRVKKFCHVSSVAALGHSPNGNLTDEQTLRVPSRKASGYAESKFFSEMEIWRGMEEGLNAVIVNPSIVLGPGNWNSGSPQLFKKVNDGFPFFTKGVTGFVDVKDVVRSMIMLMDDANFDTCKNNRYILNAENLTYQDIFNRIADRMLKPRPWIYASGAMLELAWRLTGIYSFLLNKTSSITRETAFAANSVNKFNGSKIIRTINFDYLPITRSIEQTVTCFQSGLNK